MHGEGASQESGTTRLMLRPKLETTAMKGSGGASSCCSADAGDARKKKGHRRRGRKKKREGPLRLFIRKDTETASPKIKAT